MYGQLMYLTCVCKTLLLVLLVHSKTVSRFYAVPTESIREPEVLLCFKGVWDGSDQWLEMS